MHGMAVNKLEFLDKHGVIQPEDWMAAGLVFGCIVVVPFNKFLPRGFAFSAY